MGQSNSSPAGDVRRFSTPFQVPIERAHRGAPHAAFDVEDDALCRCCWARRPGPPERSGIVPARPCGYCPWQRLSLRPLPQGHCSLRPSLRSSSERMDTNARMPRV